MTHRVRGAAPLRAAAHPDITPIPPLTRGDALALLALVRHLPIRTSDDLGGLIHRVRRMSRARAARVNAFLAAYIPLSDGAQP